MTIGRYINKCLNIFGVKIIKIGSLLHAEKTFHSLDYLRHSARRLEHLSSLKISVRKLSVLEIGAGIGDHSHYYMDRYCKVTITDARKENIEYLRKRFPNADIRFFDMEKPQPLRERPFDVIHCYGLLYHLSNPIEAIAFMSEHCKHLLFLETCVSFGEAEEINLVEEDTANPSQSYAGMGCRPTRPWLWRELKKHFENVYIPKTQPNHKEFPTDWTASDTHQGLTRSVFICSRNPLENENLSTELLTIQHRHE